jgi:flagellar assembly protein FliH
MSAKVLKSPAVVAPEVELAAAAAMEEAAAAAFEQGRAAGAAEATAALEAEVALLADTLAATAAAVTADAVATLRLDSDAIVGLAMDVAAWFVGSAVEADPDVLVGALRDAVATLVEEQNLILSVAPSVGAHIEADPAFESVTVRADAALGPADFRLIGNGAVIERSWSEAIADITPDLAGALELARTKPVDRARAAAPDPESAGS